MIFLQRNFNAFECKCKVTLAGVSRLGSLFLDFFSLSERIHVLRSVQSFGKIKKGYIEALLAICHCRLGKSIFC